MSKVNVSPWVARFDGLLEREAIRQRAEFTPNPLPDLLTQHAHVASKQLEVALKQITLLTEQELDFLMKVVHRAHAHTLQAYSSVQYYMANLHSRDIETHISAPICLTGLGGTGKSQLFTALQRALPESTEIEIKITIMNRLLSLNSCVRSDVNTNKSFIDLLEPWLPQQPADAERLLDTTFEKVVTKRRERRSLGGAVKEAMRYCYKVGLHTNIVDEMQFLTLDQNASTNSTKFLLMMRHIGVPFVYAANYSFCHKLLKRNQEDRDRLLSDVIVLRPLEMSTEGLSPLLLTYDKIMGACVKGSLCEFIPQYASMTFGIRRKICDLTVAAFAEMRKCGDAYLTAKHLKTAYDRFLSKPFRDDVQCLLQANGAHKPTAGRSDLWCPFGLEYNRFSLMPGMGESALSKSIGDKLLRDSLTETEKKLISGFETTEKAKEARSSGESERAKPTKKPKTKRQLTAAEILQNTIAHKNAS